jgi:acetoin utilization protein AcuB
MKVKDIMSYNVVTMPSSTSIAEAKRIMGAHNISRLPIVDKDKLVGIVTDRSIERVSPTKATSLSVWELSYLLEKTPVRDIMKRDVVTLTPDMDSEEAVAIAQSNKVGSAVVVDNGKVVGIVTTTDFFDKIVNPLLGIGVPGTRLEVTGGMVKGKGAAPLEEMLSMIHSLGFKVSAIHVEGSAMEDMTRDVCFHIRADNVDKLVEAFKAKGYNVRIRNR